MQDASSLETYRSLRATIKHADVDGPVRSVLVVDVDRKEPSGVARNIARAFAVAQERCVLIDTNVRNASAGEIGLSDHVRNASGEVHVEPDDEGLFVIGPGTIADPDVLATPGFTKTMERIVEQFDCAVVTCDVYPESSDAIVVAPLVDAVILVISAGVTGREPAVRARDSLERVGAKILGMVMIERPRRWF